LGSKNQWEVIRSNRVLSNVVERLDLADRWGYVGTGSGLAEFCDRLRKQIDLSQVRSTTMTAIGVTSEKPEEAADLANAIAESYRDLRLAGTRVDIVDRAEPSFRPVRPNRLLNLAVGLAGGLALGLAAGLWTYWFARPRNPRVPPAAGSPEPLPAVRG
jgi:capsular polysaccharide biosynthesis protein